MAMTTIRYTGSELQLGRPGDAGIDLPAYERTTVPWHGWRNIPVDVCVELPEGYWGMIIARSSTFYRKHLMVNQAVIDNGYRGELFVCVYNLSTEDYTVEEGERLAQLIPMPMAIDIRLERVLVLSSSERGDQGFGSTG